MAPLFKAGVVITLSMATSVLRVASYDEVGGPQEPVDRFGQMSGIGHSDDWMIRVVVDASGAPTSVTIDPRAMKQGSRELGEAFVAATRAALADLHGQVVVLVEGMADEALGSSPTVPDEAVRVVNGQANQAMNDFDAVRRNLFDRLSGL